MVRINKVAFVINWILIAYTIFSFLSPYVNPENTIFFGIFGLGFPFLFFANLLFICFWLAQKSRRAWLSAIFVIISWPYVNNIVALNFTKDDSAHDITVATYNMQFAKPTLFKEKQTADRAGKKFETFLKTLRDIDVLCLQEFNDKTELHLDNTLKYNYKYTIPEKTIAILSKYPISDKGILEFGSQVNNCLWADLNVNGKMIRVYTAHLQSNQDKAKPPLTLDMKGKESVNAKGMMGLLKYYQKYTTMRTKQALTIREHADASPYPYIICGDFNDPPQSYTYKTISNGLNDSFCESGLGLGATYGGIIPALRIDYILSQAKIKLLTHEIIKHEYSDHYIVKSNVAF